MDMSAILALIEKGLTYIPIIIQAGESVEPALKTLIGLVTGAQSGTVTQDQLDEAEAALDAAIADFNTPIDDDEATA